MLWLIQEVCKVGANGRKETDLLRGEDRNEHDSSQIMNKAKQKIALHSN